jgi:hypothetical protein
MIDLRSDDYFLQRPHHNLVNKLFYSDFMKRYNPLHEWRSYHPLYHQRLANWYGQQPQITWVDGIIDYTYNKYNTTSIGHFHMHENRKNKPFKTRSGGDRVKTTRNFILPTYVHHYYPMGCNREIKHYKDCVKDKKEVSQCIDKKINIMEVCPKWVLEDLREKKRILMRATLIDNETYRRAMRVSSYNQGRSLRNIQEDIKGQPHVRHDSYWADDRYNPTVYPSPDHNSNINLGDNIIYNDTLGGNRVQLTLDKRSQFAKSSYDNLKNIAEVENQPIPPEK